MRRDLWLLVAACAVLVALALMFSCSPRSVKVVTASRDSTRTSTERITDTVRMSSDSALLAALLECDSLGRVRISRLDAENGRLISQVLELQDNLLSVKADAKIPVRWREVIRSDTVRVREEVPVPYEVVRIKTEHRLRWWQEILCWLGALYLLRLVWKLARGWKNLTFKTLLNIL